MDTDSSRIPDVTKQLRIITILVVVSLIISVIALGLAFVQSNSGTTTNDQNQLLDSDNDGVPDNSDIFAGNAKLIIYIQESRAFSNFDSGDILPAQPADQFFRISIDYNNDGVIDDYRESHTIANTNDLILPFFTTFDIPDNATSVSFKIEVFEDEMEYGHNEKFDCSNNANTNYILQTITPPFKGVWEDGTNTIVGCCLVKYSCKLVG